MNYEAFQRDWWKHATIHGPVPSPFLGWYIPHWVASSQALFDQYSAEYLRGTSINICPSDFV